MIVGGSRCRLRQLPPLIHRAEAVPDLQAGAVGGAVARRVQAPARLRVAQRAVALLLPDLGAGAVAVPQLVTAPLTVCRCLHVQALAKGP